MALRRAGSAPSARRRRQTEPPSPGCRAGAARLPRQLRLRLRAGSALRLGVLQRRAAGPPASLSPRTQCRQSRRAATGHRGPASRGAATGDGSDLGSRRAGLGGASGPTGGGNDGGPPAARRPGPLKSRSSQCQIAAAAGLPGPPLTVALRRAWSARRHRRTKSKLGCRARAGAASRGNRGSGSEPAGRRRVRVSGPQAQDRRATRNPFRGPTGRA